MVVHPWRYVARHTTSPPSASVWSERIILAFYEHPPPFSLSPAVLGSGDDAAILQCLSLGAVDFWVYPLRQNEVAGLWTRVWWRKTAPQGTLPLGNHVGPGPGGPAIDSSGDSSESEPARCVVRSCRRGSAGCATDAWL